MTITTFKSLTLAVFLFAASFATQAQSQPKLFGKTISSEKINPENGLIRCASTEYEEYLATKYPERKSTAEFENWLAPKIEAAKAERMARRDAGPTIITIPVVVHVVHNEQAIGNENIADAQVISQITVLNQDFRRMMGTPGYNTNPVGADMEIQFALAVVDPSGNPTNGIDRKYINRANWNESGVEIIMKPQTSWDPAKYFNIWVCNFGGDLNGVLGYAQFPSQSGLGGLNVNEGASNTDGVIIGYKYFGSSTLYPAGTYSAPYNKGRTLTHEIGHCFGLRHINGDNTSCTVDAADSFKDYCPDTPATKQLSGTCTTTQNTCPLDPGNDMVQNYMDYTPDTCMNIFTQDQKGRMMAVLQNSPNRATLVTSTVWQQPALAATAYILQGASLYPNPATDALHIVLPNGGLPDGYTIFNSLGQTVSASKIATDAGLTINTSGYSNGIYFIKIDKDGQSSTLKFVKN